MRACPSPCRAAARCNKGVEVLLAVALEHFVLVVVRVLRGPTQADEATKKLRRLVHCQWCEERLFLKLGNMVDGESPAAPPAGPEELLQPLKTPPRPRAETVPPLTGNYYHDQQWEFVYWPPLTFDLAVVSGCVCVACRHAALQLSRESAGEDGRAPGTPVVGQYPALLHCPPVVAARQSCSHSSMQSMTSMTSKLICRRFVPL